MANVSPQAVIPKTQNGRGAICPTSANAPRASLPARLKHQQRALAHLYAALIVKRHVAHAQRFAIGQRIIVQTGYFMPRRVTPSATSLYASHSHRLALQPPQLQRAILYHAHDAAPIAQLTPAAMIGYVHPPPSHWPIRDPVAHRSRPTAENPDIPFPAPALSPALYRYRPFQAERATPAHPAATRHDKSRSRPAPAQA